MSYLVTCTCIFQRDFFGMSIIAEPHNYRARIEINIRFQTIDPFTVSDAILVGGANTAKFTVNVWEKSGVWRSIIRERLTFCNFYELQT